MFALWVAPLASQYVSITPISFPILSTNRSVDNSVFISATRHIPANIAAAGIAAGLPTSSVTQYVGDVVAQNATGLATIPGISPAIIGAGVEAVLDTYSTGFRNVWITAIPFIVLAAICEFSTTPSTSLTDCQH